MTNRAMPEILELRELLPHRLDDQHLRGLGCVHGRAEMLPIARKQVAASRIEGSGENRAILVRQLDRQRSRGRGLRYSGNVGQQLVQACTTCRKFVRQVAPRFLGGVRRAAQVPTVRALPLAQKGSFAARIVHRREQDIGIQETIVAHLSLASSRLRSVSLSWSSRSHSAIRASPYQSISTSKRGLSTSLPSSSSSVSTSPLWMPSARRTRAGNVIWPRSLTVRFPA